MRKGLLILLLLAVVGGGWWWQTTRSTPEWAMAHFTADLTQGKTEPAYQRLTSQLTQNRESYWQEFLGQFRGAAQPELIEQTALADPFNTYNDSQKPQRFVYEFTLNHKIYRLTIVTLRYNGSWKVDELYGAYH